MGLAVSYVSWGTNALYFLNVAQRNISLSDACPGSRKTAGFGVSFSFAHVFGPRGATAGCSSGKGVCSLCLETGLRLGACPPGVPTIVCLGDEGFLDCTACVVAAAILRIIILIDVKN